VPSLIEQGEVVVGGDIACDPVPEAEAVASSREADVDNFPDALPYRFLIRAGDEVNVKASQERDP